MNQTSNQKLNDKTWARWSALFVVAFTMMAAYYVNDIMAPLKKHARRRTALDKR